MPSERRVKCRRGGSAGSPGGAAKRQNESGPPNRAIRRARRPAVAGAERATGIEPAYRAWEASALPLSYARMLRFRNSEGSGIQLTGRSDRIGILRRDPGSRRTLFR